jgi:moderate conductance mechanosensitive channel
VDILITIAEVCLLILAFTVLNQLISLGFSFVTLNLFQGRVGKLTSQRQNSRLLLLLACVGLCFLVISVNGVLIYQGKNVQAFQLNLIQRIPAAFWTQLALAIAKSISLLLVVQLGIPSLHRLVDRASRFAKNYDRITANDNAIEALFVYLKKTLTNSIWMLAGIWCAQFLYLPAAILAYLYIALKSYLAIAIGRLLVKAFTTLIDTLDALSFESSSSNNLLRYYERFRYLIPALKKSLTCILYVGIAALIFEEIEWISWLTFYANKVIGVITIYFVCRVFIELANVILEDVIFNPDHLTDVQKQRRLTIIPLFKNVLRYVVYFVAALLVLKLFDLDPTPVLAGAGLVGLIVGLGAQNLINDIVCGFFALMENYYLVGDYIEAGRLEDRSVEGIVEVIDLRTTQIRHPNGQLQIIRNGEIGSIVNYSKQYIYANVDVSIPGHISLEQAGDMITAIGQQLKAECSDVLEPTQMDGLETFGAGNLVIRTLTMVKPGKHLSTERLLRKLLQQAFDQVKESPSGPLPLGN